MADASGEVWGELPIKGGMLRVRMLPGMARNVIRAVQFSGPFKAAPESATRRLEEALAGVSIDEAPGRIEDWFAANPGAISGVEPDDLLTALSLAHMKVRITQSTAPDPSAWKKDLT